MPLPLYGFRQGDTLGLLILAEGHESVRILAQRLQAAAEIRVAPAAQVEVVYRERVLSPESTVAEAGFRPLERFDVREVKRNGVL